MSLGLSTLDKGFSWRERISFLKFKIWFIHNDLFHFPWSFIRYAPPVLRSPAKRDEGRYGLRFASLCLSHSLINLLTMLTQQIYPVKCDSPCGMRILFHGEPISLGPNKLNEPNKPNNSITNNSLTY